MAAMGDGELSSLRLHTIGFVFQQFNLIPTLTASQNVEVALAPVGQKAATRRETVLGLLESVGLGERADHVPSKLSGGEQQRVAIARALANAPHVLLADEPTGNLDTATGAEILDLLMSLSGAGRTVIVVTHDTDAAGERIGSSACRTGGWPRLRRNREAAVRLPSPKGGHAPVHGGVQRTSIRDSHGTPDPHS